MMTIHKLAVSTAALALSAGMSMAATVSFTNVTNQNYQTVYNDFLPGLGRIVEDFSGEATRGGTKISVNELAEDRTDGNKFESSVGLFEGLGGTGSGNAVTGDGSQIQIRSGNNHGRFNPLQNPTAGATSPNALKSNFLDSNDTFGFKWSIDNDKDFGGLARGVSAFITDPNDSGANLFLRLFEGTELTYEVNVQALSGATGNIGNGTVWHLTADFGSINWTSAVFEFEKCSRELEAGSYVCDSNQRNDGFAISNATAHVIPLPAPAFLLLGGMGVFGGMAALRRRRQKASA